ncbi:MAG: hypothetical protein L6Q98_16410 [Anaerolineae bacterium]|nr:hypothetical protein [Anaerolineae bacterium]NUQ04262.1 hypothetical protein [Anaerolineae bacterium]
MDKPTSLSSNARLTKLRLTGPWQATPVPLDGEDALPDLDSASGWREIPECAHLQTILYPEQPYWGDAVRAVNDHAWLYRRTFQRPDGAFERARLRFEGVDYYAQVWANGTFAGRHEGHFAPFDLDVTRLLSASSVELAVRVSAPWDPPNRAGTYPSDHVLRGMVKGLYEHGEGMIPPAVNPIGIWRPVWLLLDQGVSIDHIGIRTTLDGRVSLRLRIANSRTETWQGHLHLAASAENHQGGGATARRMITLPPGEHFLEETLTIADPHWWWSWDQGSPDLYRLEASLVDARGDCLSIWTECFGVRCIALQRAPERFEYRLNDRPVFLRGSAYMPSIYLSECSEAGLKRDITLAGDANLNLLRVHVHVSPPEVYDLCDRAGMMVWQDFELNWIHDATPEFEARARAMQREMIDLLGNHPSVITWACHNEPTMVFARRRNLEQHPDPALYADALAQDPTRPVFICSGQMEDDWRRAGDVHTYYGAIWTSHFTDVYAHRPLLNTEFGFEAPAARETLQIYPMVWERLNHLEGKIDSLWEYQADLIQFHTEHFRRLRGERCAGYIHFWLIDQVPQVGCGVLDSRRLPKAGYAALRRASQPLLIMLEHDGRRPRALWALNDTPRAYTGARLDWRATDADGLVLLEGEQVFDVAPNVSQRLYPMRWAFDPRACQQFVLRLTAADGELLCENVYRQPFARRRRPAGYPWKFDLYLGTKVFDRAGAASLADSGVSPAVRLVPLKVREAFAERVLRQRLPNWVVTRLAWIADALLGG